MLKKIKCASVYAISISTFLFLAISIITGLLFKYQYWYIISLKLSVVYSIGLFLGSILTRFYHPNTPKKRLLILILILFVPLIVFNFVFLLEVHQLDSIKIYSTFGLLSLASGFLTFLKWW